LTPLRLALAGLLLTVPPCQHHGECAPGHVWIGDQCLVTDCEASKVDAFCVMDDGTTGNCFGDTCQKVDLASNQNCGQYGVVCPNGEACQNFYGYYTYCGGSAGISYTCDSTVTCPDGYVCNYGECILSKCDNDATEGKACANSTLYPGFVLTGVCCGTSCLPATGYPAAGSAPYDDQHCGGCGIDCGSGSCLSSYQSGTFSYDCVPKSCEEKKDGTACAAGSGITGNCCGGQCSSLQDNNNCGVCGFACPTGLACYYGFCTYEDSSGNILGCANTACPTGFSCVGGYYCEPSDCSNLQDGTYCSPDGNNYGTCCGGSCVAIYGSDNQNCGRCGNACSDGFTCIYGSCYPKEDCTKNADQTFCLINGVYGSCCEGTCQSGTCGLGCNPPDVPQFYSCFNPDAGTYDSCTTDTDCPTGFSCVTGTCYQQTCAQNYDNAACAFAGPNGATYGQCCGGQCADIYGDSNNCGGCGQTCASQTTCQFGGCYGPNFQYVQCTPSGGGCQAGSACSGSVCRPTSCKGLDDGVPCGYGIQNGSLIDGLCCAGVCVAQYTDPSNCGSCGTSCGGGTCNYGYCSPAGCNPACRDDQVCASGVCVGSVCDPSAASSYFSFYGPPSCQADDGTVGHCCGSGACEEIANDPQNCGGCGIQCPEGQTCDNGACSGGGTQCGPNNLNSFCDLANGLSSICCAGIGCTDTSADPSNCGSCGAACSQGQICSGGVCGMPALAHLRAP
jgi:hypothetical protein